MEHTTIYKDENLYCAFPDIAKLESGELLVAFREAPRRKTISHHDPQSRAVLVRSKDSGRTWGEKTAIYADEDGVQDPSIMQLKDGALLSNFFKWRFRKNREDLEGSGQLYDVSSLGFPEGGWTADIGTFVVRSEDSGRTWDKIPSHFEIAGHKTISTSSPALELTGGTILLPVYSQPVTSGSEMTRPSPSFVMRSRDKGKTWAEPALIAEDQEGKAALEEPALVRLKSGKIICMMRADSGGGDLLRQAESSDNGKTWAKFWETPIMGHPPHLLQLTDGRILCTYGYRHKPFGIRASLSSDEGRTWDLKNEIIIRDDGMHTDLGYPSSAEIGPGRVLTAYYFHDEKGTRFIAGTFFKI